MGISCCLGLSKLHYIPAEARRDIHNLVHLPAGQIKMVLVSLVSLLLDFQVRYRYNSKVNARRGGDADVQPAFCCWPDFCVNISLIRSARRPGGGNSLSPFLI